MKTLLISQITMVTKVLRLPTNDQLEVNFLRHSFSERWPRLTKLVSFRSVQFALPSQQMQ